MWFGEGPAIGPGGPGKARTAWERSGELGRIGDALGGAQGSLREAWTQTEPGGAQESSGLVNLGEAMGAQASQEGARAAAVAGQGRSI